MKLIDEASSAFEDETGQKPLDNWQAFEIYLSSNYEPEIESLTMNDPNDAIRKAIKGAIPDATVYSYEIT
jgi:hypothetical protein